MKFDFTEEQRLLADSVRRFVAQDYPFDARRGIVESAEGFSPRVWATFAELGLLGIPFAADDGGFGGGAVDLMPVMEAFGEALVVEPFVPTLMAGRLVARLGSPAARAQVIPAVIEGRMKLALAHAEHDARYDLASVEATATRDGSDWRLTGEKCAVLHARAADALVVSARAKGTLALFLVGRDRAGVELHGGRTFDGMRAADVILRDVRVDDSARLGSADALAALEAEFDFATALACAEAVGAMKSANGATLEYLKTRKQFGVPIGAFQALQHRMVDMVIEYEQARSMASLACAKVDTASDARERARIVSAAKIRVCEACRRVSQESVQLHGGMGMTDELKVSHTFRRLTVLGQQFGDADHHLERFASLG
ncbi:MAG TPA: acyl-CoA dehydrogenase [Usitatibacter sp.]|jgi:alkylation response protein AidB-like acyl-CoA dehydrogenase|nr:acyl-CoA dehydrogenase [Usitatibacter sp.]